MKKIKIEPLNILKIKDAGKDYFITKSINHTNKLKFSLQSIENLRYTRNMYLKQSQE